ncbi:hypothetical protein GCM10010124_32730 [Pilimelia terevasa]|uniref:N-acetyltransferase domain-containing protein n=1 Tax=Pilimelia terevasa TaxID=53372 RepID=A0A8J3FJ62_9ACTN|nr:GNAT family N-acetyltransferase [Pilimelia terevasa]GGK37406.1 hypothetical protein GCM10010124_32730 [Pilimelia terevasa]
MPLMRPATDEDLPAVLAMNADDVPKVAAMDRDRLAYLRALAHRFHVVDVDGTVAGFVVTLRAGTAYDSLNYRWFADRYGDGFHYLDRIVIHPGYRRRGLAGFVYDQVEQDAAAAGRLALEVNLVPRNEPSLAFHTRRGFAPVGERGDPDHLLSMLVKPLPGTTGKGTAAGVAHSPRAGAGRGRERLWP